METVKKYPPLRVVHERKVPSGPLTDRQKKVLGAMLAHQKSCETWRNPAMTCNMIGHSIGFRTGSDRYSHNGKMMGAANRVIGSVKGLERRGLVKYAKRPDGLTGTAYRLTDAGVAEAERLEALQ